MRAPGVLVMSRRRVYHCGLTGQLEASPQYCRIVISSWCVSHHSSWRVASPLASQRRCVLFVSAPSPGRPPTSLFVRGGPVARKEFKIQCFSQWIFHSLAYHRLCGLEFVKEYGIILYRTAHFHCNERIAFFRSRLSTGIRPRTTYYSR